MITAIGSLPHQTVEEALDYSFQFDLPFLPQLSRRYPQESLIYQALHPFPGLHWREKEGPGISFSEWKKSRLTFTPVSFPPEEVMRAFIPFLEALEKTSHPLGKLQLGGPVTCLGAVEEGSIHDPAWALLAREVETRIAQRSLDLSRSLLSKGILPIFFFDEPALGEKSDLGPLRRVMLPLRAKGVRVGLHCCGEAPWKAILSQLPLDYLSLDAPLSLLQLLKCSQELDFFLKRGGHLSLGVISTSLGQGSTIPPPPEFYFSDWSVGASWRHFLLTPACGLHGHSPEDAERIYGQLRDWQRHWNEFLLLKGIM